ncbi:hypothetical protein BDV96DRAFT_312591 [Lophiotrema nucula]|uniref:Apple domain-containing protein n=1 Tax=Lophiotrema nucula TaxID=690887 RepID=A0A6A5ZJU2_9PLEO|nr:hypothetical protein BDV96DRAFT_312591 [Lophiotrema nucula]
MVDRNHHGLSNIRAVRRDTFGPGPGLGDCSVMPVGEAPLPDVDTPTAFVTNDDYHEFANEAQTPEGYDLVFRNHNATVESPSYLGLWTIFDYDPDVCAEVCYKQPTCKSFNLYISRDPSRDPGPRCPNPPAVANFNCALYSEPFNATMVTNLGQKRPPIDPNGNDFLVKLKASNGYVQNGEAYDHYYPLIGYDGPQTLPGAVNASDVDQGEGQFINTLGPYPDFKPYQCARTCDAVSEQRRAEATVECLKRPAEVKRCTFYPCQYFNIYTIVDQDGQKHTYCALFDAAL